MLNDPDPRSPKQARSEEMRRRILSAGRRLLKSGAFEKASIADIAAEAQCSVGAFYRRFADKESYEIELLQSALAEGMDEIDAVFRFSDDVEALCRDLVTRVVHRHRLYRPIYRTALVRTIMEPDTFLFTKKHSTIINERFIEKVQQLRGVVLREPQVKRVYMALQMFHGTVVNAQVTRPGPLYIDDDAFGLLLAQGFSRLVLDAIGTDNPASLY